MREKPRFFSLAKRGGKLYNRHMSALQEKLKLLPDSPGVYIMLDKDGAVIYLSLIHISEPTRP